MPILSPIGAATSAAFGLPKSASGSSGDPYFYDVPLFLNGDGTNGAQNNTFLDSSSSAISITRNGNTTQGSFTPYGSLWSNYFGGNESKLTLGTTSSFNFLHNSSALFTIEMWVNVKSTGVDQYLFSTNDGGSANVGCNLQIQPDGKLFIYITRGVSGAANTVCYGASTSAVTWNQWTHIAVTYDQSLASNNAKFYFNGVAGGTVNKTGNSPSGSNATYALSIGADSSTTGYPTSGYISNLRVSNSIVYSSGFTPSTTPLTTSSQGATSVAVLTCQSNRFVDNSSNSYAITVSNTPSVQRFSPFNPTESYDTATIGGSAYFDGSGDYLNAGVNSAFSFGTGNDFCIEGWVYPNGTTPLLWFGSHQPGQADGYYSYLNPPRLEVFSGGGGGGGPTSTTTPTINAWSHIAITRQSSVFRVFLNGVMTGYSTNNKQVNQDGRSFCLAGLLSGGDKLTGNISNFRICNGSVPTSYQTSATSTGTAVFTPPTSPMTTSSQGAANVVFLANMTNAGIFNYAMATDLETVGNAQISTSVKKFGTGSLYFDGTTNCYLTTPNTPVLYVGPGDFTVEFWVYFNTGSSEVNIASQFNNSGGGPGWTIYRKSNNQIEMYCGTGASGGAVSTTTATTTGTWYYVAFVRSGTSNKVYLNGTLEATATISTFANETSHPFYMGYRGDYPTNKILNGYVDDFRITQGYARYSGSTMTVPTAALPTY